MANTDKHRLVGLLVHACAQEQRYAMATTPSSMFQGVKSNMANTDKHRLVSHFVFISIPLGDAKFVIDLSILSSFSEWIRRTDREIAFPELRSSSAGRN